MFTEILVCAIGFAFSLFLFILSRQFPPSSQPGVPSSAFLPALLAFGIFLLALIQVIIILLGKRRENRAGAVQPEEKQPVTNRKQLIRVAEIVLLILLYGLLWNFEIGHFLINSIVIFIPVALLYGGAEERAWWKTAIFVVGLVVFIYVLFRFLLKVAI